MADVTFQRQEYRDALAAWALVSDVCAGQAAVKAKGATYLPQPNASDTSDENALRYTQYLARAAFYNATGRTLQGLVGAAYRKWPMLDAPGAIGYVAEDVDGAGVSVYQQSQSALGQVLKLGRHALLVDYPTTDAPASRADMASGRVRATVASIDARQVINWRTEKRGAQHVLSLVVIAETRETVTPDGFGLTAEAQYRVLRLSELGYTWEIWRAGEKKSLELVEGPYQVLDGAGRPWDEIPFAFVGAENNDASIDSSPLKDLADVNIAHYRNSADYEDSVYLVGQPQFYMAGLTEEWRDWMQQSGVYIGARAPILLPQGGSFGVAQAQPNSLAREAMQDKEAQMIALGARLLQPGSAVKTATESQGEQEAQHSVLSLACSNVSEAYSKALGWMARFMGADGEAALTLSQDFVEQRLDPAMLTALIGAWQSGKLPEADLWEQLRKYGVIDGEKDDETIRGELETQDPGLGLTSDDGSDG